MLIEEENYAKKLVSPQMMALTPIVINMFKNWKMKIKFWFSYNF